jgi:hypothetical protein
MQAFFPKNRGRWKEYSSWEPEVKEGRKQKGAEKFDVSSSELTTWRELMFCRPRLYSRSRANIAGANSSVSPSSVW